MDKTQDGGVTVDLVDEAMDCVIRYGKLVGLRSSNEFKLRICSGIHNHGIASPIEQLLFAAIEFVREVNHINQCEPEGLRGDCFLHGLRIIPQFHVLTYRSDFKIDYYEYPSTLEETEHQKPRTVLVECDSQKWHERSEEERRYEKARDRKMISDGYQVFHYTGKEIIADPIMVAAEVVAHVTHMSKDELISSVRDIEKPYHTGMY